MHKYLMQHRRLFLAVLGVLILVALGINTLFRPAGKAEIGFMQNESISQSARAPAPVPASAPAPRQVASDLKVSRPEPVPPPMPPLPPPPGAGSAIAAETGVQRLIKNADLILEVKDLSGIISTIEQRVEALGGIIASTSLSRPDGGKAYASMTLRIPAGKFVSTMGEIEKLGTVKHRHTYTNDVTQEYMDLEARIANLSRQEERLREILRQAKNVEEVLKVESELWRIRGDIEVSTGRLNFLKDRVSFSTINLSLEAVDPRMLEISTEEPNVIERSARAFINSINMLIKAGGDTIVFITGFSPLLVLIIPLGLLGRKFYRQWAASRRQT